MGELPHLSDSAVLIERSDLEVILRALVAFQQASAEAAEIILRRLDDTDGDPDLSPDGDELDGSLAEDDFSLQGTGLSGPGCPLSDPGEDDDPDAEHDGREEEYELTPDYGIDQTNQIPEAMVIASDRNAMRVHRDRIRRTRCDRTRGGITEYRLR
jgi:hypothetical protein